MHLHFVLLLALLLAGAAVHIAKLPDRSPARAAETLLRYLLVGYCGVPMLLLSAWALARPDQVARMFGVGQAGPLLRFFAYAYLGMSLIAILVLWYGGGFLVATALVWAVYFGGATVVHLTQFGQVSAGASLEILAGHGLIALLLLGAVIMSGAWRRRM